MMKFHTLNKLNLELQCKNIKTEIKKHDILQLKHILDVILPQWSCSLAQ